MKALTLTQPWASSVALGNKHFETRSWRTNYRGLLAIHAAKGFPKSAQSFAQEEQLMTRLPMELPFSAIVAIVTLVDCKPVELVVSKISDLERRLGDYSPGRWAWQFENIIALPHPVSCSGALSLWQPPTMFENKILEQLATLVLPK